MSALSSSDPPPSLRVQAEFERFAPSLQLCYYMGTEPQRAEALRASNGQQRGSARFQVLLTTFEYLMGKLDRPRLSRVRWKYLIMDEAHRIKNSGCKLNRELGFYSFERRLLVSGTPVQNNLQARASEPRKPSNPAVQLPPCVPLNSSLVALNEHVSDE